MLKYTAKRLFQSLITILIAVTVVFLLLRMLPTDYYFTEDQLMKFTPEQKQAALEAAGLLGVSPCVWARLRSAFPGSAASFWVLRRPPSRASSSTGWAPSTPSW